MEMLILEEYPEEEMAVVAAWANLAVEVEEETPILAPKPLMRQIEALVKVVAEAEAKTDNKAGYLHHFSLLLW